MAKFQLSTRVRNGMLNAIPATIGAAPTLKIFSGTMPDNPGAADSGTVLASMVLPSTWLQQAVSGTITMTGQWEDTSADNDGTAAYFRKYSPDGACDAQGTVSLTGGGGAMTVDNVNFRAGQDFKVTGFSIIAGNL